MHNSPSLNDLFLRSKLYSVILFLVYMLLPFAAVIVYCYGLITDKDVHHILGVAAILVGALGTLLWVSRNVASAEHNGLLKYHISNDNKLVYVLEFPCDPEELRFFKYVTLQVVPDLEQ